MVKIVHMRGLLASLVPPAPSILSLTAACAAALTVPVLLAAPGSAAPADPAARSPAGQAGAAVPGSTQSLRLAPLRGARVAADGARAHGLAPRDVRPFSLLGVVWNDPDAELHGRVEVRTRDQRTGRWSGWQALETHQREHAADPASPERETGRQRGGTAPLWVGASDGVEVRVLPGEGEAPDAAYDPLPEGLTLELVDPGTVPGDGGQLPVSPGTLTPAEQQTSAVNHPLAGLGATEVPARSAAEVRAEQGARELPYAAAQPSIVTRRGWGADESIREKEFLYTDTVKAAFVHHSATGNNYRCEQAPEVIRGIYRYHVESEGWRDIGYNFLVDKCGTVYEGRAGGVAEPVMGAHTLGFNENSTGVAVLGTFTDTEVPAAALDGLKKLTAWKLGLFGADPAGTTRLVSGGGNRYPKGQQVELKVISGHRDGFSTECPGERLYRKLGEVRSGAAQLQGR